MKRILAVLALLIVVLTSAFADIPLLARSILSSNREELLAMTEAFGLETDVTEEELVLNLLRYFSFDPYTVMDQEESPAKEKATSILIDNADMLYASGDTVIMSGNVRISFKTDSDESERTLVSDSVAINLAQKVLDAAGSVSLEGTKNQDRTFEGQVISLDWSSLDVLVFEGVSSTGRKNSSGTEIIFYVAGDSISYAGASGGIFFRQGTIATTSEDPYWSITAQKLSLSQNDLFVDRAWFRLGRVPIFYFPIFFYPGTTLSFNPAIGISSEKGMFLTTTYEVYGKYPKLGVLGSKGRSNQSDSERDSTDNSDVSKSITSFLSTSDDSDMIHDGFYYRALEEDEELSDLEKWARSTSSYMAVFADTYEYLGTIAGFDTLNYLLDKKLTVSAVGVIGYSAVKLDDYFNRFRYSFDFNFNYKKDKLSVTIKLPTLSDPYVRRDYLNRNTAFALDALLGADQFFPTTYSEVNTYTWSANASYSFSIGAFSFNLSSLKADIDFKLNKKNEDDQLFYKADVVEASLPYLSFASAGTFLNLKGTSKKTTKTLAYTSVLAQEFSDELALAAATDLGTADKKESVLDELKAYKGPDLKLEETTTTEAASFKVGYTYSQSLDNIYKKDLKHDNVYTRINGTIYANASAPARWLDISETIKPEINYSKDNLSADDPENMTTVEEINLTSVFKASVPRLGITYNLQYRFYTDYHRTGYGTEETRKREFEWGKEDVQIHNVTFSKSLSRFTFGFFFQFKPLTEMMKPSVSYSDDYFKISADFSREKKETDTEWSNGKANLNMSFTNSFLFISANNSYDFTKVRDAEGEELWNGYSLIQKATLKPLKGLTLSENWSSKGKFRDRQLSFSASYVLDTDVVDFNASSSMSYRDRDSEFIKDTLNISLRLSQEKITFWRRRMGFDSSLSTAFNYDFQNPYRTSLTISFRMDFSIAEFLDLSMSVSSANKSFSRYYKDGKYDMALMWEDFLNSFDFFSPAETSKRRNTGFNLSSYKVGVVHYMRDWNLYIDAQGSLTTQYSNKYEWVPTVTVYLQWNAIPELRTEGSWDSYNRQWE
ncbi:MAG: hypothetical protein IKP61_04335 [Spirochaetales bacterium]|nr:hypothetical protein [Spirochaetales bacterium]